MCTLLCASEQLYPVIEKTYDCFLIIILLIVFLFLKENNGTCGFGTKDLARNITDFYFVGWAKQYSNYISDTCLAESRAKGLADLDNKKYQCNPVPYYYAVCGFDQSNQLNDAYQGCQKLKNFTTNAL